MKGTKKERILSVLVTILLFISMRTANSVPFANINVKFRIENPPCVLNDNRPIVVDFKEVIISRINPGIYKVPVDYTIDCGSSAERALSLKLEGTGAGFEPELLETSRPGLAIGIEREGVHQPLNTEFSFTYPYKPALSAVLVKQEGAKLDAGGFNANAIMIMAFE